MRRSRIASASGALLLSLWPMLAVMGIAAQPAAHGRRDQSNMAALHECLIAVAAIITVGDRHAHTQETLVREDVDRCMLPLSPIETPAPLDFVIREMCRRSPTFRRQLMRLATAPGLRVTLAIGGSYKSDEVHAVTQLARERGVLRRANVEISRDYLPRVVELIAHEFEHVIEQLDDVDLTDVAHVHRVVISRNRGRRAYETERARHVGRAVAAEFNQGLSPHDTR